MAKKFKQGTIVVNTTPNLLTPAENDYSYVVQSNTSLRMRDIVRRALEDSNLDLTEQQVYECLDLGLTQAFNELMRGNTVVFDGFFSARTTVSGTTLDPTGPFDHRTGSVNISLTLDAEIKQELAKVQVRNDGRVVANEVGVILNYATKSINTDITPGAVVEIRGNNIRVANNASDIGGAVYFYEEGKDSVVASVKIGEFIRNTPSLLMFVAPAALQAGKRYTLRISTFAGANRSTPLKNQRMIPGNVVLTCL